MLKTRLVAFGSAEEQLHHVRLREGVHAFALVDVHVQGVVPKFGGDFHGLRVVGDEQLQDCFAAEGGGKVDVERRLVDPLTRVATVATGHRLHALVRPEGVSFEEYLGDVAVVVCAI